MTENQTCEYPNNYRWFFYNAVIDTASTVSIYSAMAQWKLTKPSMQFLGNYVRKMKEETPGTKYSAECGVQGKRLPTHQPVLDP